MNLCHIEAQVRDCYIKIFSAFIEIRDSDLGLLQKTKSAKTGKNIHLLCKEKCLCLADLFDWFMFLHSAALISNRLACLVKSKPV